MKHYSNDYKISAVKYYISDENITMDDVCNIYNCSKASLKRWKDKYLMNQSVERKNRKYISYKISKKQVIEK